MLMSFVDMSFWILIRLLNSISVSNKMLMDADISICKKCTVDEGNALLRRRYTITYIDNYSYFSVFRDSFRRGGNRKLLVGVTRTKSVFMLEADRTELYLENGDSYRDFDSFLEWKNRLYEESVLFNCLLSPND